MDLLRAALPTPDPTLAAWADNPFLADHAVQALAAGREQPGAAGAAMGAWFRRTRRLGSRDRRRVQALTYGVVRQEAFLSRLAEARGRPGSDADLVSLLGRIAAGDRGEELVVADPVEALSVALSVPGWLAGEWCAVLGPEEVGTLAKRLSERAPLYLRADAARGGRTAAATALAAEGIETVSAEGPWALAVVGRANVLGSRAFREGRIEVQDLSSQAFVEAVAAGAALDGARVLDLCAGAGGKSLALAALGARVQAWDLRRGALRELEKRARRAGHRIAVAPPGEGYDVVVVDAPCSGTGRLMREPALRWGLSQDGVPASLLDTQVALIADGAARLRSGGLLAYATCSLVGAENDPPVPADLDLREAVVRWPHRQAGDGFGWRLFRRS